MCSVLGICDFNKKVSVDENTLFKIGQLLEHRGKDQNGVFMSENVCFAHNRLAVIDIEKGLQPMTVSYKGRSYTIVYNGELYNTDELKRELIYSGVNFLTSCDTEVVLYSYILWGKECSGRLNGIFAFVIYDYYENKVFFSRDRFGVKPFFYTINDGRFIFSSEIKSLLKFNNVKAQIDKEGIWQLIYLTPMRIQGKAIFKNIEELKPACQGFFNQNGIFTECYWSLKAEENEESTAQIIEKTRYLVTDAIRKQLVSDVPLCTLLSGGIDSSVVSSVAQSYLNSSKKQLSTYSFQFAENEKYFKGNLFVPESDDEYALYCASYLKTNHKVLVCDNETIVNLLNNATYHRDIPAMGDIDSSLLYFCSQIKNEHTVCLSGECADEIFGGYPWFYRSEMLQRDFFPWIHYPHLRAELFTEEFARKKEGYEYVSQFYIDTKNSCPLLKNESENMKNSRFATFLSVNWFMQNLLERKDRMSMASSVEVRVPFADHRIAEYIFNVPWAIKYFENTEKWLLRKAMEDYLPQRIINRKKSPYPKTANPLYEQLVLDKLQKKLLNSNTRLNEILKKDAVQSIMSLKSETFFGQLMAKPQLIAWLLQLDFWLDYYNVEIV